MDLHMSAEVEYLHDFSGQLTMPGYQDRDDFAVTLVRESLRMQEMGWVYAVVLSGPLLTKTGRLHATRRGHRFYELRRNEQVPEQVAHLLRGPEAMVADYLRRLSDKPVLGLTNHIPAPSQEG